MQQSPHILLLVLSLLLLVILAEFLEITGRPDRMHTQPEPVDTFRATRHWDSQYESKIRSAWTANLEVQREVNLRTTGDREIFWLDWFFTRFLDSKPTNILSLGCGDGTHEIMIASRSYATNIFAFDASPAGINIATQAALDSGCTGVVFKLGTFEQFAESPPTCQYDLALFAGSLHHVRDLEDVLFATRSALRPGGKILVNEYVGACYQLYPDRQVNLVNRILSTIDPIFKSTADIQYVLPSIDLIYKTDPTEGVRSSLIPTLLPRLFRPIFERPFGGALLHPLFGCLDGARINDNSLASVTLVKALIALENELTVAGILPNDFLFALYELS